MGERRGAQDPTYQSVADCPADKATTSTATRPFWTRTASRVLAATVLLAGCAACVASFVLTGERKQEASHRSSPISLSEDTRIDALEKRARAVAPGRSASFSRSLMDKQPKDDTIDQLHISTKIGVDAGARSMRDDINRVEFLQVHDGASQAAQSSPPGLVQTDIAQRSIVSNSNNISQESSETVTSTTTFTTTISYPLPYPHGTWPDNYEYAGGFPKGFIWGMGTASYQVEGAYREDGRGASIWDTFTGADTIGMPGANCSYCCKKRPCTAHWAMKDSGATGNVAADHYHLWKTDIALMKAMGLKHYRFSLSWSRLIPTGKLKDGKNHKAISFYNNLINELEVSGITPYVTIYHWDLPQGLLDPKKGLQAWWSRDEDGKPNGQLMPDWLDYVNLCFEEFGDRIKFWITFNEPWTFLFLGSGYGKAPSIEPFLNMSRDPLIGGHNVLNAHAAAVALYRKKFQAKQQGTIGITNNMDWREPRTTRLEDMQAAERTVLFAIGWFAEPIFGKTGDYPLEMREVFGSKLPDFTREQKDLLKGSADFFGFNHYGTGFVAYKGEDHPGDDMAYARLTEEGLPQAESDWLFGAAWGFRKALNWISRRYNNPPLMVTEGGWSLKENSAEQAMHDRARVAYYANYTSEMRKAIYEDGIDVRGYFAWSLLDNFEWDKGYKERFGTTFTEYNFGEDPNAPAGHGSPTAGKQIRRRKESSCWLEALWHSNQLVDPDILNYDVCTGSQEFHGEFRDPTQPECTRLLEVHAPGTKAMLFDGCASDQDRTPRATATLSGSTIIANFSSQGGPDRLIGFWSSAANAIIWSDGGMWTKIIASEMMREGFQFFRK